jgi:septal ring factor EnvC (AmiA/AmiB activator)
MKDPAGALILICLVLLPPAAVLAVIREQMARLRETFLKEMAQLRQELLPHFQPEKQLEPQLTELRGELSSLNQRMAHLERMLVDRSLDEP